MKNIKLVALDLDGTLFNSESQISPKTKEIIKKATDAGVYVVISTGRPFKGIPFQQFEGLGIKYAITTNGSGVYEMDPMKPIFVDTMSNDISFPIIDYLSTKNVHFDAFCDGGAISTHSCIEFIDKLILPDELKYYLRATRTRVDDVKEYLLANNTALQKMTLNFQKDESGVFIDREDVKEYLTSNPKITVVSGGFMNLEFTKAGVNKGVGLTQLAKHLNVPIEQTMAIGDTENDIEILKASGFSVAMGNAIDEVKKIADFVTLSNDEDGVGYAIEKFVL